jgi:phage shock protein PspC (stress-responsive transcriptional regulator)
MEAAVADSRLRRDTERGVVAGVLAGLARRLGLDPVILRVGFVILTLLTGGLAVPGYALAWALMPADEALARSATARARRPITALPGRWRIALGVGFLTLGALLAFRELGLWWSDRLVWPTVLAAAGATLLWRQSRQRSEAEIAAASVAAEPTPPRAESRYGDLYRGGFGVALVVGAALLFLSANDALGGVRDAAFAAIVAILALALILAPFLWRLGRNLAAERAARIRSQERAELAAHLHDSVLQTLTLMQKRADEPREVATLARRQERELRSWLWGRSHPEGGSLAGALEAAASEVEEAHGVPIEVVAVGDRPLDERSQALVAAAREALTNAAKFAPDAGPVSLYAEVANGRADVFIHDRGPGFDLESVPADRRGIRESIIGRMERNGGRAQIRSTPGEGTEVELTMEVEE